MGLDCSHNAFSGAYSAFNRLRQFVCAATGGSFPPHWMYGPNGEILRDPDGATRYHTQIPSDRFQCGEGYTRDKWPGLFEFLTHSDCDGEISGDTPRKQAEREGMTFTQSALERLKRDARKLHKEHPELTHSQCLELLSRQAGFKSYAALRADMKASTP